MLIKILLASDGSLLTLDKPLIALHSWLHAMPTFSPSKFDRVIVFIEETRLREASVVDDVMVSM
eukprot:745111-Ditylum_brightwellii.AAC.1